MILSDKAKLTICQALANRQIDLEMEEMETNDEYRQKQLEDIKNAFLEILGG